MKPVLSLSHLEQSLPEGILEAGERYLAEGRVEQLREVDRHLWQARVRMEEFHELEVLLRGRRVQAFSCDCTAGQRRKPCSHLVAVLLMLRRYLDQQREKRRNAAKPLPALTLPGLLPQIPAGDLQEFLKEWAGRHPEFALALKARFLHVSDAEQAITQLERLLEPSLDEEGRIEGESGASRKVTLALEQLERQLQTRITRAEEPAAYRLGASALALLGRSPGFRSRESWIRKLVKALLIHPDDRPLDPEGPRFDFLLQTLGAIFHTGDEDTMHLLLLHLGAYLGFDAARDRVRTNCRDLLRHRDTGHRHLEGILLVYYQLLTHTERQGPWLGELGLDRLPPVTYQKLAISLLEAGDYEEASLLLQAGLAHYPRHLDLLRLQARALWELHRWDLLTDTNSQLLLTGMAPADLRQAREWLPAGHWSRFAANLRKRLEALPALWERNHLLATLYGMTGQYPALAGLIAGSQSVRLWRAHVPELATRDPGIWLDCCRDFLDHYLKDHLGPQANATAQEVLRQVASRVDRRTLLAFEGHLRDRFPDRTQLLIPVTLTYPLHEA